MLLQRFQYTSIAVALFSRADLAHIRLSPENGNDRNGITGLLVFDGQRLAQFIEGPEDGVRCTRDRIIADDRHNQLDIVESKPSQDRQFSGWSLQMRHKIAGMTVQEFAADLCNCLGGVSDPNIENFLLRFADPDTPPRPCGHPTTFWSNRQR